MFSVFLRSLTRFIDCYSYHFLVLQLGIIKKVENPKLYSLSLSGTIDSTS